MKKPHYDFSKENPYNTFGKDEFLNANTGNTQRIVNEDWRTLSQKGGVSYSTKQTIEDTFDNYICRLPEILDLSDMDPDLFVYSEKPSELIGHKELREFNLGTLENIYAHFEQKGLIREPERKEQSLIERKYELYQQLPPFISIIGLDIPSLELYKNAEFFDKQLISKLEEMTIDELESILARYK